MKSKIILTILAGLLVLACGPITIIIGQPEAVPTPIPATPTPSLPDLMITSSIVSMVDINGNCLGGYALTAMLFNQGGAAAPDVVVEELMSGHLIYVGTLEPERSMPLQFPASPNGMYRIMIDPQNQIVESNEANNIVTPLSAPATPPGYCLPEMMRTPTTTPDPLYLPSPTP